MCTLRLTDVKWPKIGLNSRRYRNEVSFLIDYASRQTSFELSTNPLKVGQVFPS